MKWCVQCMAGGTEASCKSICDKNASATCTTCMDSVTSCGETDSKCKAACEGG